VISWTDLDKDAAMRKLITDYSVAFLNKYVKSDPIAKPEQTFPGVADLEVK
jgi:hypothetical protein